MSDIETLVDDVIEATPAKTSKTKAAAKEETVTISVASTDRDTADVFVGVNGRTFLIKRDAVVTVPKYIYEHLRDAKETIFDPKTGEERKIASYNVTMA
jgi:hypothetical protein